MRPVVALFAKAPRPGFVKTRLAARTSRDFAAELHAAFVADTISRLRGNVDLGQIILFSDIATDAWISLQVPTYIQANGDLGNRMKLAFDEMLREYDRALILGADSPTVPVGHLAELLSSPADVSIGPATDGGYYAISASRTAPTMFDGVRWSTAETLSDTITSLKAAGLSTSVGQPWYDVDELEDLVRAREELLGLPATSAVLRRHREQGLAFSTE